MLSVLASRRTLRPTLLLAVGAVAVILVACGNDSSGKGRLLSAQQASELKGTLTQVEQDVAAKNCTGAAQEAAAFEQRVVQIQRLNRSLRSALRASSRRLQTLVDSNCQAAAPAVQTPTTTTTTPETGPTEPSGKVKKEKKPPKENKTPPGQGGQQPPGQDNGGGGAGIPGESGGDGTQSP